MQVVRKRTLESSQHRLCISVRRFIELLEEQNENEAVIDLNTSLSKLEEHGNNSDELRLALESILEAFDGDHELSSYMLESKKGAATWGAKEELHLASTEVFAAVKRMLQGFK
jgi:hypothetical protein